MNNQHYEVEKDGFIISTNRSLLDIAVVHHYLSIESYWAKNIPLATVKTSINNSLCFGVYDAGEQIGFARLVTDMATFAYLADVFIVEAYRGRGLSKWLIQIIQAHPELQNLRRWMLGTKDAHGLYVQFGWQGLSEEVSKRFMQRHNPNVYNKD
jgi:GNAT superfamily N-acetyltransferase